MSSMRPMKPMDLLHLESVNLDPLTETYNISFYLEYLAKWPTLCQVIVSRVDDKIEGYILGKVEASPRGSPTKTPYTPDTNKNIKYLPWHAHVTALTVAPASRRIGHARKLTALLEQQAETENCWFVDLFVRKDNVNAIGMYKSMGYSVFRTVKNYYADGEDAYDMRKPLKRDVKRQTIRENGETFVVHPDDVWEESDNSAYLENIAVKMKDTETNEDAAQSECLPTLAIHVEWERSPYDDRRNSDHDYKVMTKVGRSLSSNNSFQVDDSCCSLSIPDTSSTSSSSSNGFVTSTTPTMSERGSESGGNAMDAAFVDLSADGMPTDGGKRVKTNVDDPNTGASSAAEELTSPPITKLTKSTDFQEASAAGVDLSIDTLAKITVSPADPPTTDVASPAINSTYDAASPTVLPSAGIATFNAPADSTVSPSKKKKNKRKAKGKAKPDEEIASTSSDPLYDGVEFPEPLMCWNPDKILLAPNEAVEEGTMVEAAQAPGTDAKVASTKVDGGLERKPEWIDGRQGALWSLVELQREYAVVQTAEVKRQTALMESMLAAVVGA